MIAYPAKKSNFWYEIRDTGTRIYLVFKSHLKNNCDFINRHFQQKIRGVRIPLSNEGKEVIVSEIGLTNIVDVEELFQCKLVINPQNKDLTVLAGKDRIDAIKF